MNAQPQRNFLSRAADFLRAEASSRLARDGLVVLAASLLGRVLALGKEMLAAAAFGVGGGMDAYVLALLAPSLAANLLGAAWATALVPALSRAEARSGPEAARRLLASALGLQALLLAGAAVFLALLPALAGDGALRFLAPKAGPELLHGIRAMLLALLPLMVLGGLGQTLAAVVNWRGGFGGPAVAASLGALAVLGGLAALAGPLGPLALAVAAGAGAALEFALLARQVLRLWPGLFRGLGAGLLAPARALLADWGLLALGAGLLGCVGFVEGAVASTLGEGAVSALNYAVKLPSGFSALLGLTLSTVLLPYFTQRAQNAGPRELRRSFGRIAARLVALAAPLALAGALASPFLVELLFQRGRFDAGAAGLVAGLQAWYFIQLPFCLLGVAAARLLQALGRLRFLLWLQAGMLALDALLCLGLTPRFGPAGIAMASTAVYAGSALCSILALRRVPHAE